MHTSKGVPGQRNTRLLWGRYQELGLGLLPERLAALKSFQILFQSL